MSSAFRLDRRRLTGALAAAGAGLAILLAGCGGGAKKAAATTTTEATSTTAPATTEPPTTPAPPPVAALTGLPQPDGGARNRVALVVKIDNVDPARPQSGIGAADVVYEEMVEGMVTRLIAVFQSNAPARVGPVRSTRTTDLNIVASLNHPLYAYSGGNASYVAQLRASPVTDVGADAFGAAYFRSGPHAQPHNLYANTAILFGADKAARPPAPMFAFRAPGADAAGAGLAPGDHLDLNFGFSSASWDWDAAAGLYHRGQNGSADVDDGGTPLRAANVIVQFIPYSIDGYASGEGISPPPPIPKGQVVGSGTALVLTGGKLINARWSKPAPTSVTQFTDTAGQPIQLAPGPTWIELPPIGTATNVR